MKKIICKKSLIFTAAVLIAFGAAAVPEKYLPPMVTVSAEDISSEGICVDEVNFPDSIFRQYVIKNIDTNDDNMLSDDEIKAVKEINVIGTYNADVNITSLKGIEHFTALEKLGCDYNKLTEIDLSGNTSLKLLSCDFNQLTRLDLSNNTQLYALFCNNNQIESIDVSSCNDLYMMYCGNNRMTSVDLNNNTALEEWDFGNNIFEITVADNIFDLSQLNGFDPDKAYDWIGAVYKDNGTIYVSDHTDTVYYTYDCGNNKAVRFKLTVKERLETGITIDENNFPDPYFREYVINQIAGGNNILSDREIELATYIHVAGSKDRYGNIKELTGIEYLTRLTSINCSYNQLTQIDVSKNTALTHLYCNNNQLTELDVSNNPSLSYLDCGSNMLTGLDLSSNNALNILLCNDNCREISADGNIAELSVLKGFEAGKVTEWENAVYNSDDNTISVTADTVTYSYDCGNGKSAVFSLKISDYLDIGDCINGVNSLYENGGEVIILDEFQMKMIEIVLENDYAE